MTIYHREGARRAWREGELCRRQAGSPGFTLLEMSVVLVVVGMVVGALSIGKDLQRTAEQQTIYARFVQPWAAAYNEYFARTGVVVGDDPVAPTLKVNKSTDILCDEIPMPPNVATPGNLYALMDSVGIEMPSGRAEGREAHYVYEDSNGNPMEVQVCFQNVTWPDSNDTSLNNKNAMVLSGLTPDLARQLDSTIDGRPDARFGLFRQFPAAGLMPSPCVASCGAGTESKEWTPDNTVDFAGGVAVDEDQIAVVTAYYRMNQ